MYKILFVCHGNICRSPMAEFIFNDLLERRGITSARAESAATSTEEIGNPVHRGTVRVLSRLGIDCSKKRARQVTASDYDEYDLIVIMEEFNRSRLMRALKRSGDPQGKIHLLLDWSASPRDIDDPWYTGDFEKTFEEISEGCEGLLEELIRSGCV